MTMPEFPPVGSRLSVRLMQRIRWYFTPDKTAWKSR